MWFPVLKITLWVGHILFVLQRRMVRLRETHADLPGFWVVQQGFALGSIRLQNQACSSHRHSASRACPETVLLCCFPVVSASPFTGQGGGQQWPNSTLRRWS